MSDKNLLRVNCLVLLSFEMSLVEKTPAWGENINLDGEENLDKNLLRVNGLVLHSFKNASH